MDVVSYRGPGVAGGVSSGLGSAWARQSMDGSKWWYLNNCEFEVLSADAKQPTRVSSLPKSLVKGHYIFCNEFIWPVMHDLPEYAIYLAEHHEQFNEFNKQISAQINAVSAEKQYFFIQDYQLGLAPKQLTQKGHRAVIFWHTPWPKHVPSKFSPPIRELARGLLGASA